MHGLQLAPLRSTGVCQTLDLVSGDDYCEEHSSKLSPEQPHSGSRMVPCSGYARVVTAGAVTLSATLVASRGEAWRVEPSRAMLVHALLSCQTWWRRQRKQR